MIQSASSSADHLAILLGQSSLFSQNHQSETRKLEPPPGKVLHAPRSLSLGVVTVVTCVEPVDEDIFTFTRTKGQVPLSHFHFKRCVFLTSCFKSLFQP
jgi:hypothetical protein